MFPTFTGNARRRPQINLSGRQNQNPFAASPTGITPARGGNVGSSTGKGAALANAQQDRIARQQERERTKAATLVQSRWRGNVARKAVRRTVRDIWDAVESEAGSEDDDLDEDDLPPYTSDKDASSQLKGLLKFVDLRDDADIARLQRFHSRWTKTLAAKPPQAFEPSSQAAGYRLAEVCMRAIARTPKDSRLSQKRDTILPILKTIIYECREEVARSARSYYTLLWSALEQSGFFDIDLVLTPLKQTSSAALSAYQGLALGLLRHDVSAKVGEVVFSKSCSEVNCKILGRALSDVLDAELDSHVLASLGLRDRRSRLSLLAQFIYIYRHAHNFERPARFSSDQDFIHVVGLLLSSLAEEVEIEPAFADPDEAPASLAKARESKAITQFERDQLSSLVDQESIRGLLGVVNDLAAAAGQSQGSHSRTLATYILTLLRLFPRRANDIRMWLYMGLGSDQTREKRPPVINYFWKATSSSTIFETILRDSRAAIKLLKPRDGPVSSNSNMAPERRDFDVDDQWRLMLLFFELYNFVLVVTDDDEFFKDGRDLQNTRTLTLRDIEKFTIFLKNLAFTMYYNVAEIIGGPNQAQAEEDLGKLFRKLDADSMAEASDTTSKQSSVSIAGVQGVSLDYVKDLVTGLLRQLYARDSRRPFLPKDHWLMTSRFDMTNFIDGVVEEEERRRHVEQDDEPDGMTHDGAQELEQTSLDGARPVIGIRGPNNAARFQQMQQAQRKASRKRYLEAVAPRQQILQNMPFFIPFTTRVQIFRRFVHLDQFKRRNGYLDQEMWQWNMNPNALQRHHAKIRREHEFEDAFAQYFNLGPALKEPIQITFVDKFDAVEAGIDGGGVTKEFLTSVTNQIFSQTVGIRMFAENDQHLLFPNPSALDETRELLREAGLNNDTPEFRTQMLDLLNRYEFLGRIIGKCLYEGILIDIGFAGFFLLKWALTGGSGSAPKESGYRANLNDLRDFDEGLYQGLVSSPHILHGSRSIFY